MKKYILIFASIGIFNIYSIKAQVNGAILQGNGVTASGQYSSAIGNSNMSLGASSFSMGFTTQAKGISSFAGGWESVAEGDASFAFGYSCTAKQAYNIVFGSASQAYMPYGIAIGNNAISGTTNKGMNAICIGNQAHAEADYSMAFGQYVKSSGNNSIAIGKGFSNTQFLVNNTANSIALGMGSTVPTLFIKTATGSATATGTVGIGTTLIGSKLQVNGNVAIGYSNSTAAPANGMLINGNLGIGTTAAATTEKLTVNGKVKTNALVLLDGEITSAVGLGGWNKSGNNIYRMNGNVGIGTNNPNSLLTLQGLAPEILLINNGSDNEASQVRIASDNGAARIISNGDAAIFIDSDNNGNNENFQVISNCHFYGTPAQCPNIKQLFVVTNGGSSINTNLNINGNMMLYDDGRIWAKEIKVASNNPWSDFVFDKNYKLRSLSEVEAFVNTHKHLPDVPSAAEVAKNGIDLAEMNKILLQKIEELTIYLVEQNKRIEYLSQQNIIINSKIAEIEQK